MDQHLAFLISQAAHVEREVYAIQYPEIQYPRLVPVDESAHMWADSIVHFSRNITGEWQEGAIRTTDIPLTNVARQRHTVTIVDFMNAYEYTEQELGQAQMLGIPINTEQAQAVRYTGEKLQDDVVINGRSAYGWDSLINSPLVTASAAAAGVSGATLWTGNKTGLEIAADINNLITGIYTGSETVEMADTVGLPPNAFAFLASRAISPDMPSMNIMNWVRQNNVYTAKTGQPLNMTEIRGLERAGRDSSNMPIGRAMAYRRDPNVVKFHRPMAVQFYQAQMILLRYCVPALMRLGGLEIRRPGAFRYVDGILPAGWTP